MAFLEQPLDPALRMFLWGCVGSASIEILSLHRYYLGGRDLPKRYGKRGFWVVRLLLVLIGGAVSMAYASQGIQSDWLGIHLGAATPTILANFSRKAPDDAADED